MVVPNDVRTGGVLDADSSAALREILSDPALPVAAVAAGSGGVRAAILREAVDHLTSVRALAVAGSSAEDSDRLLADLAEIDVELAAVFGWHRALVGVLAAQEPSRARNAVLGDVSRGDVLTLATSVRSWAWLDERAPSEDDPIRTVEGEIEVDEFPGLYDHVLIFEPVSSALVVLPTHRDRISWEPVESTADSESAKKQSWVIRLSRVTFHLDETIALEGHPRGLEGWREPIRADRSSAGKG